jgi:DNA invertase Pin-like site-specific DNA recombinase
MSMEKIDSRGLPDAVLNERRRRAVKLREAGVTVRETARQCELSTHTVVEAHKTFRQGGWAAVKVQWLIHDRTPDQLKMSYALWTR